MEGDIFLGLSKFGLTPYEIKIYEVLVIKGPMGSTDVVKSTGIPQPRVYDLFNSLIKKGFIEEGLGKKRLYKAIPVAQVLNREKDWLDSYSLNLQTYVENKKIYPGKYSPFLTLVEGLDALLEKLRTMINEAETEIILSVSCATFEALRDEIDGANKRGVTIALLIFGNKRPDIDGNILYRMLNVKPMEMIISDRKSCLVSVKGEKNYTDYGLYFEEDNFIHVMSYYFYQSLWEPSKVINDFDVKQRLEYCTIWLACDAVDFFLHRGFKLHGELYGYYHDDLRHLKGEILRTERIPFVRNTFYLKDENRTYSVGGKSATIEDIKMISLKLSVKLLQDQVEHLS